MKSFICGISSLVDKDALLKMLNEQFNRTFIIELNKSETLSVLYVHGSMTLPEKEAVMVCYLSYWNEGE